MLRNQAGIHSIKVALLAERGVVQYDPNVWDPDKIVSVSAHFLCSMVAMRRIGTYSFFLFAGAHAMLLPAPYVSGSYADIIASRLGTLPAVGAPPQCAHPISWGIAGTIPSMFPPESHAQLGHRHDGVALHSFACIQGDTGLAVDFDGERSAYPLVFPPQVCTVPSSIFRPLG